uniref:Uncharacterized protein n=1 Tax=Amphimedon queenslandica TaxID=400682 RepID=A0A1X7T2I8_AMPQE
MILLLCILLYSVSSLDIRIDGDNGIDSIECLTEQPQSSCQSLKYVADTINNTGNLTIEIISPTLSLQGSVIFTDINGLTINGQGTSISCRNGSIPYGNSGIVFDTCSNVEFISFTIEHCGLLYKNEQNYYGCQSVLIYNCKNFNILKANFSDNNGYGLVLYDSSDGSIQQNIFTNNGIKHFDLSKVEESKAAGGGLHILQYNTFNNTIGIASNQFINNSATTIGGALYIDLGNCANFFLYITASNFIGNRAGTAGGAIGFIVHKIDCNYNGTIPFGYHILLSGCNITNNMAKFGGGVAIQIVHYEAPGIGIYQQELRGKLFKATLYVTDATIHLVTKISFANNTGTALYAVNTRVSVTRHAQINFSNNTGDQGGAILFADGSTIEGTGCACNASSLINISNNKALIGGAIYVQSLINIHEGTCFISKYHNNVTFRFTNNNSTSGFGHHIFASTLQDCITLYGGNATTLFRAGKMGKFEFSSWIPPPVATAPVKLVSSLNIRIDGDNGIDSIECLTEQPQSSCQSLKYVADTINNTGSLTIEIISPTLSLQGSVIFTDINGLTINGQGTSISCRNGSIPYGNSGIVFDKCSNVKLNSFTIEHCGYKNGQKYPGRQSVLFYNCKNFNILKVNFSDNNGYGLVLYDSSGGIQQDIFANNGIKHSDFSRAEESNAKGGGLRILHYNPSNSVIGIVASQFINNSATTIGGALRMDLGSCANFNFYITASNFIGNRAGTAGGAIGITNNKAKFGGGVSIQIVHYEAFSDRINIYQKKLRGKLFKATLFVTDATVQLISKILFANNTGTALYAVNTRVHMTSHAHINFSNNTGDQGGAIFFADDSTIDYNKRTTISSSLIYFSNNKALIGGAVYIQSLINIHEGTCFISKIHNNDIFHFTNNNATNGFGHDIFVSTLQDCVTLYSENATTLFKAGKMGKFKFSSWTPPPVATAPVKLSINEKELVPYPGIPYNMTITQMDEFDNNVTSLQLFPLSAATLIQNIDITYSIANNFIIVFKGTVGDTATLLLQTTEYSARKLINITLYHCPPGYTFQIDACQCSSNYYYGISGCLEDSAAIIDGGLWAGYIREKFATAYCVRCLCDYHNSKGSRHEDHVLPLNYSLLNDHVCAPHRNGVMCGSCITDYTTYLHSPSFHCGESTHCQYGPLLYIVSEIIPVTGIFL